MDELMTFFQGSLEKDFGYSDDHVIESMRSCIDELRRSRLDLPFPPPDESELPTKPFGVFVPPTIEQIIGRQSMVVDGDIADNDVMVIPADGGPVIVPIRSSMAVDHRPSSVASSSVLDHYETATDGLSSRRISVRDGRSSVTSLVDEFLDIEDDIGEMNADGDDTRVDKVEVNDEFADTRQWPWNSSIPYITSAGPTSRMIPAPALRSPASVSPMSDTGCITVDRNTVGMVSLNQPVSLVTVVTGDDDMSTPVKDRRQHLHRFTSSMRNGADTSESGVRDFFAPTTEPWSHYVRSSPYPSIPPPTDRSPTTTKYHLYALRSAKDLSRQRYFSSGRVDGKPDASYRSQLNGLSMQAGTLNQPGAVSAPVIGSRWPENNGWTHSSVSTPNPGSTSVMSGEPPVLHVRSRVTAPSGNQVGSKVIFPGRDEPPTPPSMSRPPVGSPANWIYRM